MRFLLFASLLALLHCSPDCYMICHVSQHTITSEGIGKRCLFSFDTFRLVSRMNWSPLGAFVVQDRASRREDRFGVMPM